MFVVERYRKTRFWALYDSGELVCVTVYEKGANAVKLRLELTAAFSGTGSRTRKPRPRAVWPGKDGVSYGER